VAVAAGDRQQIAARVADAIAPAPGCRAGMARREPGRNRASHPRLFKNPLPGLAILVAKPGGLFYCGWLLAFSRRSVLELIAIIRHRPLPDRCAGDAALTIGRN